MKTIIEIIHQLIDEGYDVQYHKRTDGSYRITSIDSAHFRGSKGNARARVLTGSNLSIRQIAQLESIRTPKGKKKKPKQKEILDEETIKILRRVQRKWRKKVDRKTGGRLTKKKLRFLVKEYGKERAIESLLKAERYSEGLAYLANVEHLIQRLKEAVNFNGNSGLYKIIRYIEDFKFQIREDTIYPIYQEIYNWEQGKITTETLEQRIKAIIG